LPSSINGIKLADLNYFMKNYPTGIIVPSDYRWNTLYDCLKGNLKTDGFYGDMAEILIKTNRPFTGQAMGDRVAIPYADNTGYIMQHLPMRRVIVNAGVSGDAMERATGGAASWGNIVKEALDDEKNEFLDFMEECALGDGTGRLARAYSASAGTAEVTVTCDNTYSDFGWENVALIKKDMWIEAYNASDSIATDANGVTAWEVSAVSFGDRDNGAATTGTFTISCTAGQEATIAAFFDNGALVFRAKTRSLGLSDSVAGTTCYQITNFASSYDLNTSLPMGLVGIVQSALTADAAYAYTDSAVVLTMDTFQGLARASYSPLNAIMRDATNFGGTRGTPEDWGLDTLTDAMAIVDKRGGKTDVLACNPVMALAIDRRNKDESGITVNVSTTGEMAQTATGAQWANKFKRPDGQVIPIITSHTIPENVVYGLCTQDLIWYVKGNYDFLRLYGDIWQPVMAQRYDEYEAPFGGRHQIGAKRCDRQFCIQDMATDV
jgi:hypothetical protein